MKILLYTKDNCSYCDKAKALFSIKQLTFNETKLGMDITKEDFIALFPEQKTMPLVIINGEKIGGYNELRDWFDGKSNSNI